MTRVGLLALATGVLLATAAAAQTATPDTEDGRFTLHAIENGYLRLDGRTGQLSTCLREHFRWMCQAVPDDRTALEAEIARLQGENAQLKKELLSRNQPAPAVPPQAMLPPGDGAGLSGGQTPEPKPEAKAEQQGSPDRDAAPKREPSLRLPSDAEINQMMTFLEKIWRRLVEMIGNAQKDFMRKT